MLGWIFAGIVMWILSGPIARRTGWRPWVSRLTALIIGLVLWYPVALVLGMVVLGPVIPGPELDDVIARLTGGVVSPPATATQARPTRAPTLDVGARIAKTLDEVIQSSSPSSVLAKYKNQLEVSSGAGELVVYFWGDAEDTRELAHLAATALLNGAVYSHRAGDYFGRVVFTRPYSDGTAITFWIEGVEAIGHVAENHDSIWDYLRSNIDWRR